MIRLSVIIPTHNRCASLLRCLQSLQAQSLPRGDFEVVVVDDGSTDDTQRALSAYAAGAPLLVRGLRQQNAGPAAARNQGIRHASGGVLLFLGDDIIAPADLLSRHLSEHESHPEDNVGLLGYITWAQSIVVTPFMRWLERSGKQFDYNAIEGNGIVAASGHFYSSNVSLKRRFLLSNNLWFDEDFPWAAYEDIEFGVRLNAAGFILRYAKEAVAYHDHPTTLAQACARMRVVGASSRVLMDKTGRRGRDARQSPARGLLSRAKFRAYFEEGRRYETRGERPEIFGYLMDYCYCEGIRNAKKMLEQKRKKRYPKVGVVVVNYNLKEDLLECLESVTKIDYPRFDVFVVDNASTDGSQDAVRRRFPDMFLLEERQNTGFCRAANRGIREALRRGAEYVLMLNNDLVVKPSVIRFLKDAFDADSRVGAVSPAVAFYDNRSAIQFSGARIDWANAELIRRYAADALPARLTADTDMVSWGTAMISREAVRVAGLLDEELFMYYDDTEWSVRLRKRGYRTALVTRVLAFHKGSLSSGGQYSPLFYFYYTRNKLRFMRIHASLVRKLQFSFNYPREAVRLYYRLAGAGKREHADAVLDGLWSAVQGCRDSGRAAMPQAMKWSLNAQALVSLWPLVLRHLFREPRAGTRGECPAETR